MSWSKVLEPAEMLRDLALLGTLIEERFAYRDLHEKRANQVLERLFGKLDTALTRAAFAVRLQKYLAALRIGN